MNVIPSMYSKKAIVLAAVGAGSLAFILCSFIKFNHQRDPANKLFFSDSIKEIEEKFSALGIGGKQEELKTADAHYLFFLTSPIRGTAFAYIYCFEQIDPEPLVKQRWMLRGAFFVNALSVTNGINWISQPVFTVDGKVLKISIGGELLHEFKSYKTWSEAAYSHVTTNSP